MTAYGRSNCQNLLNRSLSLDSRLAETYYDSAWVYYRIADYTGDKSWNSCAQAARSVYRDQYVLANGGAVPGYWNFSQGLTEDYLRTGDTRSRQAVYALADSAAFARDDTPPAATADAALSRETAYTIMAYLDAASIGGAPHSRLNALVDQALGHLDQWFGSKRAPYIKPFMVGLTAEALIMWFDKTGDPRIQPALADAADQLWSELWVPEAGAFRYISRSVAGEGPPDPAPDLNLLIAPLYGWLFHRTGEPRFRERGDQIFSGGVRNAYLGNGKQFNQNYRWSFDYVRWRSTLFAP